MHTLKILSFTDESGLRRNSLCLPHSHKCMFKTHTLNVPDEVHEWWVGVEWLEDLSLVEEGVDQVRVVLQTVGQT